MTTRRVLLVALCLAGCQGLDIRDFRRPFACVHDRDGGWDGGPQCLEGWSCGFDDRCFDRVLDGGQRPAEWRCTEDSHCPNAWRCGQLAEGVQLCQAIDAGAPSPCVDDLGCQGGWRCGGNDRCFDPADARDAGTRPCTGPLECPDGWRCEQLVAGRPQRCMPGDVGTAASCTDDEGCAGGFRCDPSAQRCVDVRDVLSTGNTSQLTTRRLNPRWVEPAPLLFAMTTRSQVRTGWAGGQHQGSTSSGLQMAWVLADGGLRVAVQPRDEQPALDAGDALPFTLFEGRWSIDAGSSPVELAMVEDGPVVRFANGTAALLRLTTGAWEPLGRASLLRQRDPLDDRGTTDLVLVDGARLSLLQKSSDGGLDPRRADVGDAGVINEVFAMTPEWFLVVTDTAVSAWEVGNTGVTALTPLPSPAAAPLPSRSRGVAGGFTLDGGAGPVGAFLAQTVDDAGMARVSGYVVTGAVSATGPFSANVQSTIAGFSPCPGDAALQQLSLAADTNGTSSALARCALSPSSVPVLASLPTGPGGVVQYAPFFEDQLPYRWDIIPQRTGLAVRAHAAANGLAWRADPAQNLQPAGNAPVRPVFLDRTPTALIMVPQRGPGITSRSRLYAEAAGRMLVEDPAGGLVAQLKAPEGQPLGTVAQSNRLFVAAEGVFDTSTANPRLVARAPAGVLFTAPASAASTEVTLGRARKLVLVASADSLYSADISDALANGFAQPAVFSRVFVPVPGVDLRSMTLGPADAGVSGYITTNTANLRFSTRDLLGWALTPVPSPDPRSASLPLRVWTEEGGGQARTGFSDGRVWSLPVMVPLTEPLTGTDGGALPVLDYGRLCGDLFAATPEGLHRARRAGDDGGLPRWERLDGLNAGLEPGVSDRSDLRLFEARDQQSQHLFVANSRGWLIEVLPTAPCP